MSAPALRRAMIPTSRTPGAAAGHARLRSRSRPPGPRPVPLAHVGLAIGLAALACAPLLAAAESCSASPLFDPDDDEVLGFLATARWTHGSSLDPPGVGRMSPEEISIFTKALFNSVTAVMNRPHAGRSPPELSELIPNRGAVDAIMSLFLRYPAKGNAGSLRARMANAVQVADQLAFAEADLTLHYSRARLNKYNMILQAAKLSMEKLDTKNEDQATLSAAAAASQRYPSLGREEYWVLRGMSLLLDVEIQVVDVASNGIVSALPVFDFRESRLLFDVGIRRLYLLRYEDPDDGFSLAYEALIPWRGCVMACSAALEKDFAYSTYMQVCWLERSHIAHDDPFVIGTSPGGTTCSSCSTCSDLPQLIASLEGVDGSQCKSPAPAATPNSKPMATPVGAAAGVKSSAVKSPPAAAPASKEAAPNDRAAHLKKKTDDRAAHLSTSSLLTSTSLHHVAWLVLGAVLGLIAGSWLGSWASASRTRRQQAMPNAGLERQLKLARERADAESAAADKLRRDAKTQQQKLQRECDASKGARDEVKALQQRLRDMQPPAAATATADAARRLRESSEELAGLRKQLSSAEARAGAAERRAAEAEASVSLGRAAAEDAAAESKPLATALAAAERDKEHLQQELAASQADEKSLRDQLAAAVGSGTAATRAAALEMEVEDLRQQLAAAEEAAREHAAVAAAAEQCVASASRDRAVSEDAAATSKQAQAALKAAERQKQQLEQQLAASRAEGALLREKLAVAASSGAARASALEAEMKELQKQLAAAKGTARERATAAAAAEQRATVAEQRISSAEQRATDAEQRARQAAAEANQRQAGQAAASQRLAEAEREVREARAALEQLRASAVRIDARHLETLGAADLWALNHRLSEAALDASRRAVALTAFKCMVCFDMFQDKQEHSRALDPCGHRLCAACAETITQKKGKCPMCNKPILKYFRVYD